MGDEELVRQVAQGDERALSELYDLEPEASVDGWDVAWALSRIPEKHREVLTLAYFEGLSQRRTTASPKVATINIAQLTKNLLNQQKIYSISKKIVHLGDARPLWGVYAP